MKTYITKLIDGYFITYDDEIDNEYWEGQIGSTLEDFNSGKWVLLSNDQAIFHKEHPTATIKEVWNMELYTPPIIDPQEESIENQLSNAKLYKEQAIKIYDKSQSINDFTINNTIHYWFTPEERANYRNSIDAAKLLNKETINLFVGNIPITLSTQLAEIMLAQIQLYADDCWLITKNHILAINQLNNVEDVNNYNYTIGYPQKLNFNVEL